jgi:hypothetical protein
LKQDRQAINAVKMKLNFSLEPLVARNSESSDNQRKNVSVSSKETLDMLPIVTEEGWVNMMMIMIGEDR